MLRNLNRTLNNNIQQHNQTNSPHLECIICGNKIMQNEVKHICQVRYVCEPQTSVDNSNTQ